MPVIDDFNVASTPAPENYKLDMVNDQLLSVTARNTYGYTVTNLTFDFLNRLVVLVPGSGDNRTFTFAEFDEGSIEWHYNKMLEAGRKPRPPAHLDGKPALPRGIQKGLNP